MARDRSPIVKQSRREGVALHPKAHKAMVKRSTPPGQHGRARQQKPSQFAIQLREKQKVKRTYGVLEKPFRRLMAEAGKTTGQSGATLLSLLERRLDNVIYRAGFATSRRGARQLATHGHFTVNGQAVDIPSFRVKAGDEIVVKAKSASNEYFKTLTEIAKGAESVAWLSADAKKGVIKVTGLPARADIEAEVNEQLIVEYYSR